MKTSRFALCLTLILLLLLSLSPLALAETTTAGNSAAATGVEDGSVFLAGSNTSSSAEVRGILFSAVPGIIADHTGEYKSSYLLIAAMMLLSLTILRWSYWRGLKKA